jgi:hypothetical protein
MQTKKHHFEAAAQVRKAMDDSENNRYIFNDVINLISSSPDMGARLLDWQAPESMPNKARTVQNEACQVR